MVSASANFYPAEAMIVAYSVATWDMGYDNAFIVKMKKAISDYTGLDLSNRYLFGESGCLVRRPINTFLTKQALGQFYSDLGF